MCIRDRPGEPDKHKPNQLDQPDQPGEHKPNQLDQPGEHNQLDQHSEPNDSSCASSLPAKDEEVTDHDTSTVAFETEMVPSGQPVSVEDSAATISDTEGTRDAPQETPPTGAQEDEAKRDLSAEQVGEILEEEIVLPKVEEEEKEGSGLSDSGGDLLEEVLQVQPQEGDTTQPFLTKESEAIRGEFFVISPWKRYGDTVVITSLQSHPPVKGRGKRKAIVQWRIQVRWPL